jgi:hypothetical protein
MASFRLSLLALSVALPGLLEADATIRYNIQTVSGGIAPSTQTRVVRMKDTKGLTTEGTITTVIDFARQQVTIFDSGSRLYATLSIADYTQASSMQQSSFMPASAAEMLKSMKVTCDSKPAAASDDIAGIHSVERDVNCTMAMSAPANMPQMPSMSMKMSMRTWWPSDEERGRTPALWQLTTFEQAQGILFKQDAGSFMPGAFKSMQEEMSKNQSVTLRSVMEMSMAMGGTGGTPLMRMESNAVEISSDPIDDAEFSVPAGYTQSTYADVENAGMQAAVQAIRTPRSRVAQPKPASSPAGEVRAYVPALIPLTQTEPEPPPGIANNGGSVQVLVTISPKGAVVRAEVLSGPAALRQPALDAVKKWTYRPVLRDGAPVTAYTDAQVFFFNFNGAASPGSAPLPSVVDDALVARMAELQRNFQRTPEQVLADAEQDATGRDADERFSMLPGLAIQSLHLEAWDKAKTFATELITALPQHAGEPDYSDAHYNAHMALGLIALHNNDAATATRELLESAHLTTGSPVLGSFGPDMWLAMELLRKGESPAVIDFLNRCRSFWPEGSSQLDSWIDTIRKGGVPVFGVSLR